MPRIVFGLEGSQLAPRLSDMPMFYGSPAERVDDRLPSLRARAPDVQVAVPVLGRGVPSPDQRPLTLARVDLRGLSLNGTRLNDAIFQKSNLARAALTNVRRGGADDPEMSHEAHRPGTLG